MSNLCVRTHAGILEEIQEETAQSSGRRMRVISRRATLVSNLALSDLGEPVTRTRSSQMILVFSRCVTAGPETCLESFREAGKGTKVDTL